MAEDYCLLHNAVHKSFGLFIECAIDLFVVNVSNEVTYHHQPKRNKKKMHLMVVVDK